jgi:hypothetical protein
MGRISYGLYLWQQLFFTPQVAVTFPAAAEVFLPRLALTFAVAIALLPSGKAFDDLRPSCLKPGSTPNPGNLSEAIPSSIMEQ